MSKLKPSYAYSKDELYRMLKIAIKDNREAVFYGRVWMLCTFLLCVAVIAILG